MQDTPRTFFSIISFSGAFEREYIKGSIVWQPQNKHCTREFTQVGIRSHPLIIPFFHSHDAAILSFQPGEYHTAVIKRALGFTELAPARLH